MITITIMRILLTGHADNIHKLTIARLDSGDAAIIVTATGARTFTLKVFLIVIFVIIIIMLIIILLIIMIKVTILMVMIRARWQE